MTDSSELSSGTSCADDESLGPGPEEEDAEDASLSFRVERRAGLAVADEWEREFFAGLLSPDNDF